MNTLTPEERAALKAVGKGADVYDRAIAIVLRRLEKRGLVTITRAMMPPPGDQRQPYFGAIAKGDPR